VHSCGSEQRVAAELRDTMTSPGSEVNVKVSIPVNYGMDVYIAARDSTVSVGGI